MRRAWCAGLLASAVLTSGCGGSALSPDFDEDDGATVAGDVAESPAETLDLSTTASDRLPGEPDPSLTPGWLNLAVTEANIKENICKPGWTKTQRPNSSYTNDLKVEQIGEYKYKETALSTYEEDHLIPLQLGGNPTDKRNLWPEPYTISLPDGRAAGARVKDPYETRLKRQVCAGVVSLAEAQARIGVNWVHSYYGIAFPPALAHP